MTIDITPERVYTLITTVLVGIQLWQQYRINKLEANISQIWVQISILVTSISSKLLDLDKKIER